MSPCIQVHIQADTLGANSKDAGVIAWPRGRSAIHQSNASIGLIRGDCTSNLARDLVEDLPKCRPIESKSDLRIGFAQAPVNDFVAGLLSKRFQNRRKSLFAAWNRNMPRF